MSELDSFKLALEKALFLSLPTNLKGKSAVITGCSSGIGLALTFQLLAEGCKVLGIARRSPRLEAIKATAKSMQFAELFSGLACDLTNMGSMPKIAAAAETKTDILVCNAGLALGTETVAEGLGQNWDKMISTNINSTLHIIHQFLPKMIAQKSGHIVILGSIAGHHAYAGGAVYCATKYALMAIAKALRQETCDKNIRITLISPGMVETEFSLVRFAGDESQAQKVYEGVSALTPNDIASQILFALKQPLHVNIEDIVVMPLQQAHPLKVHRNDALS